MLIAFIQAEREKLNFSNTNQVDLFLSNKLRAYLLQAYEAGKLALLCDDKPSLPMVHILAMQGLLRCIDVLRDFISFDHILDKQDRNYFHYLIAMKKYAIANKMIERWKSTGDLVQLSSMIGRNRIQILRLLANAVKEYDKEAMTLLQSILMDSKSKYQEPSSGLEYAAQMKALALVKAAFKSCKEKCQPLLAKLKRRINKLYKRANPIKELVNADKGISSCVGNKLNTHYAELAELTAELEKLQKQTPVDQEAAQKWALFSQCLSQFKGFLGEKSYKKLSHSDAHMKILRTMR
ncbi:MAG: hypothetical protein AB7I18_02475 [Candidatus Berkiella sp.]